MSFGGGSKGGGGGSAPAMPDFQGLANQMAQYDWYSQQAATNANRPNIYSPWGSMTWYRPGTQAPPWSPAPAQPVPVPSALGNIFQAFANTGTGGLAPGQTSATAGTSPNALQRLLAGGWNDVVPGGEGSGGQFAPYDVGAPDYSTADFSQGGVWPAGFGMPFLLPGDVNQNPYYGTDQANDIVLPGGGQMIFNAGGGVSTYDPQNVLAPYRTPTRETWDTYIRYLSAQSGIPYDEYYRAYERLKFSPEEMNWWQKGLLGIGQTVQAGATPNGTGSTPPPPSTSSGSGGNDWLQQRNGIWYNVNSANNKANPWSEPYYDQGLAAQLAGGGGGGGGTSQQPQTGGGGGGTTTNPGNASGLAPGNYALPGGGSVHIDASGAISAFDPQGVLGTNGDLATRIRNYFTGSNANPPSYNINDPAAPWNQPGVATNTNPWSPSAQAASGVWGMNITLPEDAQKALSYEQAIAANRGLLAYGLLGRAGAELGKDVNYSALPNWAATPVGWPVQMNLDMAGLPGMPTSPGQLDLANTLSFGGAPSLASPFFSGLYNLATTSLAGGPDLADPEGLRAQAESAVYDRAKARLDSEWNKREAALDVQLRNQGLRPGTEAYDAAYGDFQRARTDAYEQARREATILGGQEAQRLFGQSLAGRQQFTSERGQEFGQTAQARQLIAGEQTQQFMQTLQARQQSIMEATQQAQYAMEAASKEFEAAMARGDYDAARRAQMFMERTQQGQFANQAAAQEVQEQLALASYQNNLRQGVLQEMLARRLLPLNEMTALMQGQQIQAPQFPGFSQMQAGQTPDLLGAAQQSYQGAMQQYSIQQQQQANMMNGLFGLGQNAMSFLPFMLAL